MLPPGFHDNKKGDPRVRTAFSLPGDCPSVSLVYPRCILSFALVYFELRVADLADVNRHLVVERDEARLGAPAFRARHRRLPLLFLRLVSHRDSLRQELHKLLTRT